MDNRGAAEYTGAAKPSPAGGQPEGVVDTEKDPMTERGAEDRRGRRAHRFLGSHTAAGLVLIYLFAGAVLLAVGNVFELLFWSLIPGYGENDVTGFGGAIAGFAALGLFFLWFRPEYRGCLGKSGLKKGFALASLYAAYLLSSFLPDIFMGRGLSLQAPGPQVIGTVLVTGVVEEAIFRGMPLAYLMRQMKGERRLPAAAVLTSAVFALVHGTNVFFGADAGSTAVQIAAAFCTGVFFSAAYLRSGNLWPTILLHMAQNLLALCSGGATDKGVIVASVSAADFINLGLCAVMAAVGFYLIRPAKREETDALWRKKWSRPAPTDAAGGSL